MSEKRYNLLSDKENEEIWKRFYKTIKFTPSLNVRDEAFIFPKHLSYTFFPVGEMREDFDSRLTEVFKKLVPENDFMYAIEWQSSGYRFYPYKPAPTEEYEEVHGNGEISFRAYYPPYFPDGDYYFFLAKDLSWGYLGHPWQKKIYIYGDALMQAFMTEFKARYTLQIM